MARAKRHNKRRNYFINKKFQAEFISKFCILICLACVLMGIIVYVSSAKTVTTSFENLRLVVKSTADFILPALLLSSLAAAIIVSLACIGVLLFISHRIAGPLYRLERSLEQIADGDLTVETRLRSTDEGKALAASLNDMATKLKSEIHISKKGIKKIEGSLLALREKLVLLSMPTEEINSILDSCEEELKKTKNHLSYFKVE
jgi:methyl-accepting chemotaxis protein